MKEQFNKWLSTISRFGKVKDRAQITDGDDGRMNAKVYTDNHVYSISAKAPTEGYAGYLGCIASCRKARAGEEQHRGSDLADGPFTDETWQKILADIVSYELVPLDVQESTPIPEQKAA
jgi:hypothetical protein